MPRTNGGPKEFHESVAFQKDLKRIRKKYPRSEDTIRGAMEAIAGDYERVCHAQAVPGFDKTVWKYRVPNPDQQRGGRGGFRLIAYVRDARVHFLAVFSKSQLSDLSNSAIDDLIKQLSDSP